MELNEEYLKGTQSFPRLMINTTSNMIVNFTDSTTGVVIHRGAGFLFEKGQVIHNLDINDYVSAAHYY